MMISFKSLSISTRNLKILTSMKSQYSTISKAILINKLPQANIFQSKTNQILRLITSKRHLSGTSSLRSDNLGLNDEELYWDNLKEDLETPESEIVPLTSKMSRRVKYAGDKQGKNVFVLQLKMQYKSKARQSTTAELQLAESISLVNTLENWKVIDSIIIGTKRSGSAGILGSGNQEMLSKRIATSGCDCLFVVIDRLTNMQVETLRRTMLGGNPIVKIYDRYMIVLEIFKRNAQSAIAKLQIALAEIPYIRQKFENSELYKNVEKKIKKELDTKLKTRSILNTQRRNKKIPTISVFGYTNAGKTSFIKMITNDNKMQPENKLFATLDVTYHGTSLSESTQNVIFIDTIGFISDIPHNLVEAFKTSLKDAINADIIIHLIDISHPDSVAQEKSVDNILSELAPLEKSNEIIKIYNKCDKVANLDEITKHDHEGNYYISCRTGQGVAEMKEIIEKNVYKKLNYMKMNLQIEQGSEEMAFLYKNAIIEGIEECQDSQFVLMSVMVNKVNAMKFINLFPQVKLVK